VDLCIGAGVVTLGLLVSLIVPWAALVVLVGGLGLWMASMRTSRSDQLPTLHSVAPARQQQLERERPVLPVPVVAAFSPPAQEGSPARRGGIGKAGRSAHRTGRLTHHKHASV
jgi:hypothetical protein